MVGCCSRVDSEMIQHVRKSCVCTGCESVSHTKWNESLPKRVNSKYRGGGSDNREIKAGCGLLKRGEVDVVLELSMGNTGGSTRVRVRVRYNCVARGISGRKKGMPELLLVQRGLFYG
jgi:hypothetical protein